LLQNKISALKEIIMFKVDKALNRRRFHSGIVRDAAFLAAAEADARDARTNITFDHIDDDVDGTVVENLLRKMPKGSSEDDIIKILQEHIDIHSTLSIKLQGFADSIIPVGTGERNTCEIPEDLIDYVLPYYDDALEANIDTMVELNSKDGNQKSFESREQIRKCLIQMEQIDNGQGSEPQK
jgi:hypothetical protein